jgi:hypothetical protein
MDDLSNRDLSQVPDEELTPAEREELKRRLDFFVDAVRKRVIDGRRDAPEAKSVTKREPAGQGGKE